MNTCTIVYYKKDGLSKRFYCLLLSLALPLEEVHYFSIPLESS